MMRALRELDVRRLVVAALFVPLMLLSFFSVHTMPRFSGEGVDIIICTGTGFESISVGKDEDPAGSPDPSPCDWSMQNHAATLPAAGLALEPATLDDAQYIAFEKTILRSGKLNAGRHARAPPASV